MTDGKWDDLFAEFLRLQAADDARVLGPDGIRPECRWHAPCAFCGADDHVPFHQRPPLAYVRCRRCGFLYLEPRLNREAYLRRPADPSKQFYADRLAPLQSETRSELFRRAVARFRELLPAGRVLEIGAANGHLQHALRAAGYDSVGVEPNPASCRRAKADLGIELVNQSFDEYAAPDGSFDGVVFFESVYHTFDPVASLAKAYRLLKPGGFLMVSTISVGSLNWRWFPGTRTWANGLDIPFLFDFTILRDVVERSGFTLRRIDSYGESVSLGSALKWLAHCGRAPAGDCASAPGPTGGDGARSVAGFLLAPFNRLWLEAVKLLYLDRYLLIIARRI